jgi:hypothetical protein
VYPLHFKYNFLLQEAACALSTPDDVAAKIGAVNTLMRQPDGSMSGHNTDWDAAITAVQEALAGMPRFLCASTERHSARHTQSALLAEVGILQLS